MAYITISNSKKTLRKLDLEKLDEISEKLYKWDIYFFSKRESGFLKAIREFLRDPGNFSLNYYNPIVVVDSFRYLYPETQPAYHKDNTCERLKSNYLNYEVPVAIQQKGNEEVIRYREWFKASTFNEDDPKDYIYKLQIKFPYVGEINPQSIERANSGIKEKKNYTLSEIENEIDNLLRAAGDYFKNNPNLQSLIRKYQKWTFLAYVYGDLQRNESGLSDNDLKAFLRNYDETFKKPVKLLLEEYYKIKFNPEMTFEGNILEKLGFRRCETCLANNDYVLFSPLRDIDETDPLDF